ncbi:MAG: MFS transporter [Anaerolineae bacterium]
MAYTITTTAQRHLKRNFSLGVLNGAFFDLFSALLDPSLVLSWFVSQLTTSNFLIGLIVPIQNGGWFLPQLVVSSYLQRRQRKLPLYAYMAGVRVTMWGLITPAVFLIENSSVLLVVFFVLLTAYSLADGLAGISFVDIVAKAIPPTRRGAFFGWRRFLGGILALGGSLLVKYILDERHGLGFPDNYAVLFLLSFFILGVALACFILMVEPLEPVNGERVPLGRQFRRAWDLPRRDRNYRRFLMMRLLLMAAEVATPFYIVYAKRALSVPVSMVGVYLTGTTLASFASNLLWGRISDRRGNKLLIVLSNSLGLFIPLTALSIVPLAELWPGLRELAPGLFALVFVLSGGSKSGAMIGNMNFLLEIAPADDRLLYIGFTNTIMGIALLASSVGGLIVDLVGFTVLFSLALAFYVSALFLTLSLQEPRISGLRSSISDF